MEIHSLVAIPYSQRHETSRKDKAQGWHLVSASQERKNIGGETPTDARLFWPRLQTAGARLSAFHRGSRPKESFIARDSASGHASWDPASSYDGLSPSLPVPVQRLHLAPRS
jgi:hypothetical protein